MLAHLALSAALFAAPAGGDAALFAGRCPQPQRATAVRLDATAQHVWGPQAVGGSGDILLANAHVAFVVSDPAHARTYFPYGGILVDAVALAGCAQAGAERLGELGLLVARPLEGGDAIVRAFHGLHAEIVADGRDGHAARLRVTGTDDIAPRVDDVLARAAANLRRGHRQGVPLDLQMAVDYVLEPDSHGLRIEVQAQTTGQQPQALSVAATLLADGALHVHVPAAAAQMFTGFVGQAGAPWLLAQGADAGLALAAAEGPAQVIAHDGFYALFPGQPTLLAPAEVLTQTFLLGVSDAATQQALAGLQQAANGGHPALVAMRAQAHAAGRAAPAGIEVQLQRQAQGGAWHTLASGRTDAAGNVALAAPREAPFAMRLWSPGSASYAMAAGAPFRGAPPPLALVARATGQVALQVRQGQGARMPGRLALWQNDAEVFVANSTGESTHAVPAGSYTAVVSRGLEYRPHAAPLIVRAGNTTTLRATLPRLVNSAGYLQVASHVSAAPAPGVATSAIARLQEAAAAGIEVLVSAHPDAVVDYYPDLLASGVAGWVQTIVGSELTGGMPGHVVAYPLRPQVGDARGAPVNWRGLDMPASLAAARQRGAAVVQLSGPRSGGACGYLCMVGYDRIAGRPLAPADAPLLAAMPGMRAWSWDFDAIEVMRGEPGMFADAAAPERSGAFDDWLSFLNHGHRVAAMAGSAGGTGALHELPRTYVALGTDVPAQARADALAQALRAGRTSLSGGAFAHVQVGDAGASQLAAAPGGRAQLALRVEALPEVDVTHIKVLANCDEVATLAASAPGAAVKFDGVVPLTLKGDAHVVVMGFGSKPMPRGLPQHDAAIVPRFVSAAVFVDADGNGRFDAPGGKACRYSAEAGPLLSEDTLPED